MKRVLITGGSDGLGKITAQKLVAAGFDVTILSHDEARTKAAAEDVGCKYVVADVAHAGQVKAAVMQAGQIDILVNNAAVWILGPFDTNAPEQIKTAIEVNTLGTMYCTHAVIGSMKSRKSGRIINVVSQAGLNASRPERSVYNASKWAVTGFTKSLQAELKPYKIAVSGFYPDAMRTGLFAKVGDTKDRSNALDPAIAADMIVYTCQLPDNVNAPELSIQSLDY
jgi:NADP-dependent 3-hydroxy acid dehydrogenase YdfG